MCVGASVCARARPCTCVCVGVCARARVCVCARARVMIHGAGLRQLGVYLLEAALVVGSQLRRATYHTPEVAEDLLGRARFVNAVTKQCAHSPWWRCAADQPQIARVGKRNCVDGAGRPSLLASSRQHSWIALGRSKRVGGAPHDSRSQPCSMGATQASEAQQCSPVVTHGLGWNTAALRERALAANGAPPHICTGTGLTPPTSAPGLGSPLPHLHRHWAHLIRHLHRV